MWWLRKLRLELNKRLAKGPELTGLAMREVELEKQSLVETKRVVSQ